MSERLTRLTANEQKPAKPDSEGGNNDAAPRTISHDAGNSADRDDAQPNYCHADFVHGQNSSTAKPLRTIAVHLRGDDALVAVRPLLSRVGNWKTFLDAGLDAAEHEAIRTSLSIVSPELGN